MRGKDKCKILKEIRAQIAAANEIEWVVENCAHKGECRGTCPKCEAEVAKLERALERRRALGKTVAVVGLSATMMATATSCDALLLSEYSDLAGAMPYPEDTTTATDELLWMGEPLPPETTEAIDGEVADIGGVPMVYRYYPAYFQSYDVKLSYRATDSIYLMEVVEENETGEELGELQAGCVFEVWGIAESGDVLLISYDGKLYAMYQADLEGCAEPYTDIEDVQ